MRRWSILFLLGLFLSLGVHPVFAAEPGIVSGTGQFVTQSTTGSDTQSSTVTAATQALNRYKANGGTTPKIVVFFQNVQDPNSTILPALKQVFGTSIPIVGMDTSWQDYIPISLDAFPPNDTDHSLVVMALGGSSITVTTGTGTADFNSTSSTVLANAGKLLAQSLTPNSAKKNLILLFGPMHVPNNEYVVSGIHSVWGTPLPSYIKIMGWAGPYWGSSIYLPNGTKTPGATTVMGVMITGDYQWAFSGISHAVTWGTSDNAVTEITRETQLVSTSVGGNPSTIFMVPGHPDKPLFPSIRSSVASVLPASTSLFGMHQGSETGHDTTNGDVIADADHFFVAAVAPTSGTSTPLPTSNPTSLPTPTPGICRGDISGDGVVDLSDYSIMVSNFFKKPLLNAAADLTGDGAVDLSDYSILVTNFLKACIKASSTPVATIRPSATPLPSATPVSTPVASTGDWSQFGGNSAMTHFSPSIPATPWKYQWQWNGAGSDGKKQAGHLTASELSQPITGGGRVYMVAGNQVTALSKSNGTVVWTKTGIGTLTATPAYDSEFIYVGSSNGSVYKLNAATGATVSTFSGAGNFLQALTFANGTVYAGSTNGTLYAISAATMAQKWAYSAGSNLVTPSAYSATRNLIVVVSQDLYVHGVNASTGVRVWRTKPTPRVYQSGNPSGSGGQAEMGWPVVAEQHGIVFVRYRLDWDTIWTWSPYPTTNSAIRSNLVSQPSQQTLFALNLTDGSSAFIPAVGNGGQGDGGTLPMGPMPVIRTVGNQEVAYIIWRNGLTTPGADGREDATMGEMVLDGSTVPGYVAGDVRFVQYQDIQTDEMMYLSMGNDVLFHSHWLVNEAYKITDRSNVLGGTFTNPIKTSEAPFVIWRQAYCPSSNQSCIPNLYMGGGSTMYGPSNCPFDAMHRYCSAGLYSYADTRGYPPGFYEYHNDYNEGSLPFSVITSDQVIVKTLDGGIIALGSGNPLAGSVSSSLAQTNSAQFVLGVSTQTPPQITPYQAKKHINEHVVVTGKLVSVINHRPKAMYLSFTPDHSDSLLVRVFEKDISKFSYDLTTLKNKTVRISGFVTLYWPEVKDPEIIVTDPNQIEIMP